jgi:hypothetical protein
MRALGWPLPRQEGRSTGRIREIAALVWKRPRVRRLVSAPSRGLIWIGMLCYRRGNYSLASIVYRVALLVPIRRDQLRLLLAQCDIRRREFDRAFAWFLRLSNLPPPPGLVVKAAAELRPSSSSGPYSTMCVITSVMPKRIEAQQSALNSWRAAGLSVVSVNSPSEAAQLREHFPDISFQVIEQPAVDARGRPLIPIQAMVQAARNASADVCGIINSDVEFRGQPAFFDLVRQHVAGSLIFGNRIDVTDRDVVGGEAYRGGYDFFFWDRKNSFLFDGGPMVLGLPWWDFWLPLHASARGLQIKRFVTAGFVHVVHPVGYDVATFVKFAHRCAAALADVYSRWRDGSAPPDRVFLHRLFSTASAIPISSDAEVAPPWVDAMCGMTKCFIETVCDTVVLPDARLAAGTLHLL